MKIIPQFLKPLKIKQTEKLSVGLDVFGNAIPEVKAALVEGTGKTLRVVKRQEVIVKPGRKKTAVNTKARPKTKAMMPVSRKQDAHTHPEGIGERLEQAFHRLHQEFNEREQQLEAKMQELKKQHQQALAGKTSTKPRRWLVAAALAGMGAMGYMMYIMTSMQTSMTAMSGNINTMNGHMGTMATDTQLMSQHIQTMNQSMYYMNNNVAYMSGNVAQMNQKVGTLAQAAQPMSEAASAVSPFTKMFKSFMPF